MKQNTPKLERKISFWLSTPNLLHDVIFLATCTEQIYTLKINSPVAKRVLHVQLNLSDVTQPWNNSSLNDMTICFLWWCSSSYFYSKKYLSSQGGTRTHNLLIACENSDTFLSKNSSKNIIIKNNIYVRASIHLTLITIERTPIEQIFILLEGGCSQWIVNHSICDHVICDLLQYTHTEKCNLFVLYNKNSNGLLKD